MGHYASAGRLPDLAFDGTLIGDMSFDKSLAEKSSANGFGAMSACERRFLGSNSFPIASIDTNSFI
jgi:hypothetical protein